MTATYSTSLTTDIDKVRFLIGDTDVSNAVVSNEEITGLVTLMGSVYLAAAQAADGLAGKYSRSVSFAVEGLRIENTQKYEHYRGLAQTLRAQASLASGGLGTPFVGGVSKSAMDTVDDDPDREPSRFKVGQMDFPGTEPQDDEFSSS